MSPLPRSASPLKVASLLLGALVLAGCQAVAVHPEGDLPKPLVVPAPAKVAVVVTNESANYTHKESRANVDYEAQLGPAHRKIVEEIFRAEFREAKVFEDLDSARKEPGIHAIFEPRIEQFSFASAKETGGAYCAVTIRYQIHIFAPDGQQVDTLTLTGYGSGPPPKIGNGEEELAIASYAAMRDAAAKFLTQFPLLDVAKPLLASQALTPKAPTVSESGQVVASETISIEALPINEKPVAQVDRPGDAVTPASAPQAPAPLPASQQMTNRQQAQAQAPTAL